MADGGPRWLREGGVTIVWSAAAVNVFLLTWKTMVGVYKPGPLAGKEIVESTESPQEKKEKQETKREEKTESLGGILKIKLPQLIPGEDNFIKQLNESDKKTTKSILKALGIG